MNSHGNDWYILRYCPICGAAVWWNDDLEEAKYGCECVDPALLEIAQDE